MKFNLKSMWRALGVLTLFAYIGGLLGFALPYLISEPSNMAVFSAVMIVGISIAGAVGVYTGFINRNKVTFIALILIALMSSCSKVPAGYKGVKVYLLGTSKGVDHEVLGVGRYWIGWNEELYKFPTFLQNESWKGVEFQSHEGLSLTASVGVSYFIADSDVPRVFTNYRKGVDEITQVDLKNIIRNSFVQEASKRKVEEIYGSGKSAFLGSVRESVRSRASEKGITVEDVYLIGSIDLPPAVTTALSNKIEATQRAEQRENELRETEAQAKKQIAEAEGMSQAIILKANAEAQANKIVSNSLSSSLIEYEKIKKWDGKMPHVTSSSGLIIDMTKNK
jgi:regulator of protease activity HflC (stomatin/prohibitin superfamily)